MTFEERLRAALALDLPYPERPKSFVEGVDASVLLIFAPGPRGPELLLTRRTETVEKHKGQMAFPGGVCEKGETAENAALRETQEEVGIDPKILSIQGMLPRLWTVTGYWVSPLIATTAKAANEIRLVPSPSEIAETIWVPVLDLPAAYHRETRRVGAVDYPIHVYSVGPHRIWGATGAMIKNLLDRFDRLG